MNHLYYLIHHTGIGDRTSFYITPITTQVNKAMCATLAIDDKTKVFDLTVCIKVKYFKCFDMFEIRL